MALCARKSCEVASSTAAEKEESENSSAANIASLRPVSRRAPVHRSLNKQKVRRRPRQPWGSSAEVRVAPQHAAQVPSRARRRASCKNPRRPKRPKSNPSRCCATVIVYHTQTPLSPREFTTRANQAAASACEGASRHGVRRSRREQRYRSPEKYNMPQREEE